MFNWGDRGNIEKHVWNSDIGGFLAWRLEVRQRAMSEKVKYLLQTVWN